MPENNQKLEKKLTDFDADLPPNNPINIKAAAQRGLVFDITKEVYVDEDGCSIRDEYGQPF